MMLNFVVKDVEKIKGKTIMRHFKLFLQITLLLNLAFSWGKTGHRTTGEVAEHFLTEKTNKFFQLRTHFLPDSLLLVEPMPTHYVREWLTEWRAYLSYIVLVIFVAKSLHYVPEVCCVFHD